MTSAMTYATDSLPALHASTIPPIDPGPLDPTPGTGEPDFEPGPAPDPDPDPLGPTTGVPGIDPGFPAPSIPGGPAPVTA